MAEQPPAIAPVYRYFTADLLTNEILAEIPFRGVSWERALKGAGAFSGKIPITAETDSMDLYNTTMPGQTALYVVRNNVCVWGGIIWTRQYQFGSRDLAISASEFSSYFYRRNIWKTWNHQVGATVQWQDETDLTWVEDRRNYSLNPQIVSSGTAELSLRWAWTASWPAPGTGAYPTYTRLTATTGNLAASTSRGWNLFTSSSATSPSTSTLSKSMYVESGEPVSVSVMLNATFASTWRVTFRIHDGNGAWLTPESVLTADTSVPLNAWTNVSGTTVVPASGYIAFGIYGTHSQALTTTDMVSLANILVEKSDTVGTFFSGATTNTDGITYEWEDTTNASQSVKLVRVGTPAFKVRFDNGSQIKPRAGSTVKLEFYEPGDVKYNGQYRVADVPAPTTDEFTLVGGAAVADIISYEVSNNWLIYYTKEPHGFSTGDAVSIITTATENGPLTVPTTQAYKVNVPGGVYSKYFRIAVVQANKTRRVMSGTASRTLPKGTYPDTTVTVRQDTYDYVRSLIDSMFDDFVGGDFPNVYLEPGVSWPLSVVSKEAYGGYNTLKTDQPHGVAPGQAIVVSNVDGIFDGEYEVTETPTDTSLVYKKGGIVPITAVAEKSAVITSVSMSAGRAEITTATPHGFSLGQNVSVEIGEPYAEFDGIHKITSVPHPNRFWYNAPSGSSILTTTLPVATATVSGTANDVVRAEVSGNRVTLELKDPVSFSVGNSMAVAGVNRSLTIAEKALDAQNNRATVRTQVPHGLKVGDAVSISGLVDSARAITRTNSGSTVTITTARPHNFRKGNSVAIVGEDAYRITRKALKNNVVTLTTSTTHAIPSGTSITVDSLYDEIGILNRKIVNGVATITTTGDHNFQVNDTIGVLGLDDRYSVVSKEATNGRVILTTVRPHNLLEGQKIIVTGLGAPFDGTDIQIAEVTSTRLIYNMDANYWETKVAQNPSLKIKTTIPQSRASGTVIGIESFYNGEYVVTARTSRSVSFQRGGNDLPTTAATGKGFLLIGSSSMNGVYTVSSVTATTVSYAKTGANIPAANVPAPVEEDDPLATIVLGTVTSGTKVLTAVTPTTISFTQTLSASTTIPVDQIIRRSSIFNGTRTITAVPTSDRFQFTLTGYTADVLEEPGDNKSLVTASGLYNGTYTISAVDPVYNTVTYARTLNTFGSHAVASRGRASVDPTLIVSSFGPFPGNADIGMGYSSTGYTGINIEPISYRGFELKNVGEALEAYSDNINGFEYRIDCAFDTVEERFTKTFVLVPITPPNAPTDGSVSPISRFGADRLVFEYPGGSITEVAMDESAEGASTRFFAVGTTDLGPDAGPNIGIATANDLLEGRNGRAWPLLDDNITIDGMEEKDALYAQAQRYLSEAAPPFMDLTVSVNGSIPPFVDSYVPGDWCSLVLRDPFFEMRMKSGLEPREDIVLRKIDSYRVTVPDGVTFPETVQLNLIAEWEVDKRGK